MRNPQLIKLFLVLILCTGYIFSFSHYGALAYNSFVGNNEVFPEGTTIGVIDVTGLSRTDALKKLNEQYINWESNTKITIDYKEQSTNLLTSNYFIDIEQSVFNAVPAQKNLVVANIVDEKLQEVIESITLKLRLEDIDVHKFKTDLLINATTLEPGSYQFNFIDYVNDNVISNNQVLAQSAITTNVGSTLGYNEWIERFSTIEIPAHSQFSIIKLLKDQEVNSISSETLSVISSAIYKVILPTNFDIIERHISKELPDFTELGYEVKIDLEKNMDFVFDNSNDESYFLQFNFMENELSTGLIGTPFLYEYKVFTKDEASFKPKTILQFSGQLNPGQKTVNVEGKEGLLITVYRDVFDEVGEKLNTQFISEDFYPPIHRVEVHGLTGGEEDQSPIINEGDSPSNSTDNGSDEGQSNEDDSITDTSEDEDLFGKPNEDEK